MMEGLQLSIPQRMIMMRSLVIISLALSVLLSLPLWAGERYFPYSPLIDEGLTLLPPYDYIPVCILLAFLILSLVSVFKRSLLFCAVLVLAYMVLCDINRVQLWVSVYTGMLLVFVWYDGRVDDSSKFTSHFIVLQVIVASVYFFGGLHRFNSSFINDVLPQIIKPVQDLVSFRQFNLMLKIGQAIPYAMVFIGLGLIISPIRYLALALAVCLHLALLVFLFPSAQRQDYALWFSNLVFLFFLLLLFSGKTKQRYYSPTFLFQLPVFYIVVLCFVVLPFVNVVGGAWPDCLSFNYLTGAEKRVEIATGPTTLKHLGYYEPNFFKKRNDAFVLNYEQWSEHELHAHCVSEWPVFTAVYAHILSQSEEAVTETVLQEQTAPGIFVKR